MNEGQGSWECVYTLFLLKIWKRVLKGGDSKREYQYSWIIGSSQGVGGCEGSTGRCHAMWETVCTGHPVYGGVFGVEADGAVWESGNISSLLFNKESILRNNGVTEPGNPSFSKTGTCFGRNTALSSRPDIFSRPGVGKTTSWKEKNVCRGAPSGARALSPEI